MSKPTILAQILASLDAELQRYTQAARAAQADATDEQSRAENKYDTRGLESSYLAHGQSRQMLETIRAREQFAALDTKDFGPGDFIATGALIELEGGGESLFYFLGPAAGGLEIVDEGREVLVITAQSPLGRALVGKQRGQRVELAMGGPGVAATVYRVAAVV